jgi:hypothetical protein
MSDRQDIYPLWKYPAITARQQRALRIMLKGALIGLMLGIVTRVAYDYGIVASITSALRDFGVATSSMLQDTADACWDHLQFIFHQWGF